ncbi:MAG: hypothetical protein M1161_02820 [Candidatus Thermoplasmatota archaeon]|nr:hypothetical protein [Candidatus Thermoplasmatota archaeon]
MNSTTTTIEFSYTSSGTYSYSIPFAVSGAYRYPPYPSSGSLSDSGSLTVNFGANLTATPNPGDVDMKIWMHSTLASSSIPPLDYYVSEWLNSVNVTTTTTNSSSDYTAAIYHNFTSSGTYNIFFVWWASAGGAPSSPYEFPTPTISVTINPPLSVSISASQYSIDVGQSVTFSSVVQFGTPPYSYQWFLDGSAVTGATSSTWTWTPTTAEVGTHSVKLEVTDSAGDPTPSKPSESVPAITVSPSPSGVVYTGESFKLQVVWAYGINLFMTDDYSSFTFAWYLNGTIINGAANYYYSTTENYTGTYNFTVAVTYENRTFYGGFHETVLSRSTPVIPNVEFRETGLPIGSSWMIGLMGAIGAEGQSTTSIINFTNVPTMYEQYAIARFPVNYTPSAIGGLISGDYYLITFTPIRPVPPPVPVITFTEYNLAPGDKWYLNLTNGQSFSAASTSSQAGISNITFQEPKGTYNYTIAVGDKRYYLPAVPFPPEGSFTFNGSSISKSFVFQFFEYQVFFTESGLPVGTGWYVNLTGQNQLYGFDAGSLWIYPIPNGTYNYTISTTDKMYQPSEYTGTFTVNGSNDFINVTFSDAYRTLLSPVPQEQLQRIYADIHRPTISSQTTGTLSAQNITSIPVYKTGTSTVIGKVLKNVSGLPVYIESLLVFISMVAVTILGFYEFKRRVKKI